MTKVLPFADFAVHTNRAAVGFDKVFTDGKTEAASLYFRAGNAEITVKDTLMVTRVNSFPKVLHEYFHFLVHLMRTDNDTAILRRVVDGVGKEVREYPGDLLTVYKELGYFFQDTPLRYGN